MRIFIFKSQTRQDIGAFAGDRDGTRLPERLGPWRLVTIVPHGLALPHRLARPGVERAIISEGFQLYRFKVPAEAS